jgi:hypothetical protein
VGRGRPDRPTAGGPAGRGRGGVSADQSIVEQLAVQFVQGVEAGDYPAVAAVLAAGRAGGRGNLIAVLRVAQSWATAAAPPAAERTPRRPPAALQPRVPAGAVPPAEPEGAHAVEPAALAAELGVDVDLLHRWRGAGCGPGSTRLPDGTIRYPRAAVERWLAEKRQAPRSPYDGSVEVTSQMPPRRRSAES